tara:strand:+ start:634 stop:1521 length:888 start_codon:yes stop_codon:yes gene_type:complete
MPEQQLNTTEEAVVNVPTEGDNVEIELKEDLVKPDTPNVEIKQEAPREELEEYSDKVKTRIAKLTGKLRETERREQASFDYAKRVAEENKKLKTQKASIDDSYIEEYKARTEAETVRVKSDLAKAIQEGDVDAQVNAQDSLSKLAVDNQRVIATTEARKVSQEEEVQQETPVQTPPKRKDPKAEAWAEKNTWFGQDETMTYASFGVHKKVVEDGFDPNSDDYYSEIDHRMRREFPHKFDGAQNTGATKPVQSVASAGRSTTQSSGRKTVRLSPSQVHIAKRLGVPLEEYAKYVKE